VSSLGALNAEREYDPMGRLVSQRNGSQNKPILVRKYSYDLAGNLQQIDDIKQGPKLFSYDPLDRLKVVAGMDSEQFDFDPAGNIVNQTNNSTSTNTTSSNSGGLVQGNRLKVFQDYRFEYDDVGNLIQEKKGSKTSRFTYNAQNQLLTVEKDSQQFEYQYDPLGRRIQKKDAFGETTYLWDGDTLISEERNNLQTTYINEPGSFVPLCQVRNNTIFYYHNDHIGTPQALTDVRGEVVWQARYKVYGNIVSYDVEEVENNLRFQGQYFDKETGLHYNRHRYYHPVIGRFTTVDPIGLEGGNNNYQYAPNPVTWVDPLGLVDINLFSKTENIHQYATKVASDPNRFSVGAHGNPSLIHDQNHKEVTPKKLAEKIQAHPKYKKGMPVDLLSCSTGKGVGSYAQKLSNQLGASVKAPNKLLWYKSNGKLSVFGMTADGKKDLTDAGQMLEFKPTGKTPCKGGL